MWRHSLRFLILSLATLAGFRLGLSLWQFERVDGLAEVGRILLGGLRIDLSLLAMVATFPLLLAPWLGHRPRAADATAWWYRIWWLAILFMELCTPQFIVEYDTRPNRLFFEYLQSPGEVSAMLWSGYKAVIFSVFASMGIAAWISRRWFAQHRDKRIRRGLRPWISLGLLLLCFVAARGTLQHRPINPSLVAFSDDNLLNALTLNSLYCTAYAAYSLKHESFLSGRYGKMPDREVVSRVRSAAGLPAIAQYPQQPSLHFQTASRRTEAPLNLVVIVEESLGARYVGALGGSGLTPSLDILSEQGWWFERLYATGTRSVRGLEALTTGFFPTPARAVLKLPRSQRNFFTLAAYLGERGYHSRFVYGGESHFDNMKGFFLGNGFREIHDLPTFTRPQFRGSWGASDGDMFNELHQLLQGDKTPTFTLAFSVSNHSPWEYPAGRIMPEGQPKSPENSVRYADWALGRFFEKAKRSDYWDHTLFLVVADHDARATGASAVPVDRFHIPALILGADIEPRKDSRLVSQLDLPPTLLSLMGISGRHPMLGQDLNLRNPDRALMQYGNSFGYHSGNQMVVLRPDEKPRQFEVTGAALRPRSLQDSLAKAALAHALWPSLAYRQGWYTTQKAPKPRAPL